MESLAQVASGILSRDTAMLWERLAQLPDGANILEEVLEAAAKNKWEGALMMKMLLTKKGVNIVITEEVVKAAAGNERLGKEVIMVLFEQREADVVITEEVVKVAARNEMSGKEVIMALLEKRGADVVITEEVVKAVARNKVSGKEVMIALLEQREADVVITEEMIKTIASQFGSDVMKLLLEKRGSDVVITEEVVKAVARNEESGMEVMIALLKERGADVVITEEVVMAAAGNRRSGIGVIETLLKKRAADVVITEKVVRAAVGNAWSGYLVVKLLLEERGADVVITAEMVMAAAERVEVKKLLLDTMTGVVKAPARDKRTPTKIEIGQGYEKSAGISNDSVAAPKTHDGDMGTSGQIQWPTNESSDITTMTESVGDHQYLPVAGYMTDFSEESDELSDGNSAVAETIPSTVIAESTSPPAEQFRLSEMNEDLLHPVRFNIKLRRIQSYVWRESAVGQQSKGVGIQDDKTYLTPDFQLQECLRILACIQLNITFLRDTGFCTSSATILQIDPARTEVALVRSVDLEEVAHLGRCIDNTNTSSENLTLLERRCIVSLGEFWSSVAGDSVIVGLRVLDLVLVTHVYSHIGNFDGAVSKDTSTTQMFQISERASSVVTHSGSVERGVIAFCRRTLKCLNGFLGGEQVWVLHGCNTDPMDRTELWLSTTPDTFAEIWGPMWTVTNKGKPAEVLRYDLEHGSVVPRDSPPENVERVVKAEADEYICHWISNNELRELKRRSDLIPLPQITRPRLLIGACAHSVTRNTACCYNLTHARQIFESSGFLRPPGSSPGQWVTDSRTVGTSAGGAWVGAPTIQYSHTMKNTRVPIKEALYKRWRNSSPDLRPWSCLLLRLGLQVSICTGNGRKVRLVDLLAGDTIRSYFNTHPTYVDEAWRDEFERMLDTNPTHFGTFVAHLPGSAREDLERYISDCLDILLFTGIGRGNDEFIALWVLNGQAWEVAFPRRYYDWTGFAEDSSFVVLEKCLENKFGRRCCHPGVGDSDTNDFPAVLEVFLTLSKRAERPNGLREKQPTNGRPYWNCRRLRRRKHCIKLGKLGVLNGEGACSTRVLIGKWSSESLVAAGVRKMTELLGIDETHTECIHDDSDDDDSNDNILPLPYLIQSIRFVPTAITA